MVPQPTTSPAAAPPPAMADSRALHFATRILPWLAGGLMLAVYGLTLNPWVSPDSIGLVAKLQGSTWTPELAGPVTFLVLSPFGWLPAAWVPVTVNVFTAVCAALSLVWLARSVALLPHDLTKNEPPARRDFAPPPLLASRSAWLPPLLAVLVCGLQLSFWQNAIVATSEMFNLLMFAWVIRCLLEHNASGKDAWLLRGALVYGLAVANDWAMILFFPAIFLALIGTKRLFVFNEVFLKQWLRNPGDFKLRLLWQIPGCALAGLSLLLPVIASHSSAAHVDFWPALKYALNLHKSMLLYFPRHFLFAGCLVSMIPVILASLRFYRFLAGFNGLSLFLGTVFFQLVYGFFLLFGVWIMFDSPLSPRQLGFGQASLPLYYLTALTIGYFTGHFLLTTKAPATTARPRQRASSPMEQREQQARWLGRHLKRMALIGLGILALAIPGILVYKNLPVITLKRADAYGIYIKQLAQALPPHRAVVIDNDSFRLFCLEAALIRQGKAADYLLLNTEVLGQNPEYLVFLKRHNPEFNLTLDTKQSYFTNRIAFSMELLQELAKTHAVYCPPPAPAANLIAEFFYFQPQGLLDQLMPFAPNTKFAAPTPPEIVRDNDHFWQNFTDHQLSALIRQINPPQPPPATALGRRFLNTLRFWPEADRESVIAGSYYATALNDWAVNCQRAGKFAEAGSYFAEALQLNPFNQAARMNLAFNTNYLAGRPVTIQEPMATSASLNEPGNWLQVAQDGAVDEPNFCYMLGAFMADSHLIRPAIAQFMRARELAPASPEASFSLGRLFMECNDFPRALEAANTILALSPTNLSGLFLKASIHMRSEAYLAAIPVLSQILALDPTNNLALLNRGIASRKAGQIEAARSDYNALIQITPNAYPAYYDLAQMADREKNLPAAITNYELFLKYVPAGMTETKEVEARLKALKPAGP